MPRRRVHPSRVAVAATALALLAAACSGSDGEDAEADPAPETIDAEPSPERVRLVDVAAELGVDFTHGAFRWEASGDPVAMMGGGLCWLDADGDDDLDLYAVNSYAEVESRRWDAEGERPVNRLFRNDGDGFTDVSDGSGADLAVRGNGCVAADLDQDGATDLFVTTATQNVLLWGDGEGGFTDGTAAAGLDAYGWHTGAAVGDVDGDGRPDLFVSGYVNLNRPDPEADQGFPNTYAGVADLLYLNQGPGPDGRPTFRDVGPTVGLDPEEEYGLGAVFTDADGDRDLDLYVANETNPNRLYLNDPVDGPGGPEDPGFRLREVGRAAAVDDANSGMGVTAEDYDGDGLGDLFVTNFGDQRHALLRNATAGPRPTFADGRPAAGVDDFGGEHTGWGARFVDLDLDTDLDLVMASGAVPILDADAAQPLAAFANLTSSGSPGVFEDVSRVVGLDEVGAHNGRGLAAADFDDDGDMDLAVNTIGGRLLLLENRGAAGNWLKVACAEPCTGALVTATLADGTVLRREVHAGSSYLSSEDPRAHLGLGRSTEVAELRVEWPGGGATVLEDVAANEILVVDERDSR